MIKMPEEILRLIPTIKGAQKHTYIFCMHVDGLCLLDLSTDTLTSLGEFKTYGHSPLFIGKDGRTLHTVENCTVWDEGQNKQISKGRLVKV
jgi:hypothetical protein